MKFIVSSTELLNQLAVVKGVINSKNTLPILDNFLFELRGNVLKISASDLETTMNTSVELNEVEGEGVIAIEARRLTDILKEFTEQPLTFSVNTENSQVDIFSANGKFSIMGQNGEEFPKIAVLDENDAASIQMPSSIFMKGIVNTIFATADDELRPVMNGILVELSTEHFRLVASDSHKLVRYTRKDIRSDQDAQFILPKKSANILKSILQKNQGDIKIEFDAKNAYFHLPKFQLVCRLVEGKYPSYNAVIPVENPNKLIIDRVELLTSIRRVSIFSNQASNLVKLSLTGNEIDVSAQDIDFSISAYEKLTCQYEGEPMEIGFKSVFLVEILTNLESADVICEMSDPSRAGILTPFEPEEEDEDVLMLIMPMVV